MSRLAAHTVARRDQLLAILAASSEPMTPRQIADEMPWFWCRQSRCNHRMSVGHERAYKHIGDTCYLLIAFPLAQVHPLLRRLASDGLVKRSGPPRSALWEFAGEQTDLSEFEALLA